MNQAHLHSDNMEDVRERLENTVTQSSVETMYDGEDCFITVTQKNYETMNESKWSFCVDFGTNKVQMLEPIEDEESFSSDNEVFRIIKNFLNGGSSREKRMNRPDYDSGEPIKIKGFGNKIGGARVIKSGKNTKPMSYKDFCGLCYKIARDNFDNYFVSLHKKNNSYVMRVACEENEANEYAKILEKYGFNTDVKLITDMSTPYRGGYDILCSSKKPIKIIGRGNKIGSALENHGIKIVWVDWSRTDNGDYEYEIKQVMDINRHTNKPFTNLKDAIDFAKTYFGKNYDLEIWVNNEPKMRKPRGKLTFYKIDDAFHVPLSTKARFAKQIGSSRKSIKSSNENSRYNYDFFYDKLKDSPYFEEYVVRYDDDQGEDNIHTKNIPLVITYPDGKKQTYKDASLSFSGSGWRVSVGGWFGDSTYSDITNATIIDNRISITDSKNQEFDFFLDGNMIGSSRKPVKSGDMKVRYGDKGKVYSDSLDTYVYKNVKYEGDTYEWNDYDCLYYNTNGDEEDYMDINVFKDLPEGVTPVISSCRLVKSAKSVCIGFNTENGTLLWKRDDLYTLDGSTVRQTKRQDIADRWIEKYDLNTTDERRLDKFTQEGPSQIPWGLPLVEDKDQTNYNKKLASILPPHNLDSSFNKRNSEKELTGKQKNDFIKKAMKMQGYSDKEATQMVNQSRMIGSGVSPEMKDKIVEI